MEEALLKQAGRRVVGTKQVLRAVEEDGPRASFWARTQTASSTTGSMPCARRSMCRSPWWTACRSWESSARWT